MNNPAAESPADSANLRQERRQLWRLVILAAVSLGIYMAIAVASLLFQYGAPRESRPMLLVLWLFAAAFLLYLASIHVATRIRNRRALLAVIVISSCAFRVVLLPSVPIQEIDIYRYLWDGAVCQAGVSPFRYAPDDIRNAKAADPDLPSDLETLVRLQEEDKTLGRILDRVHFGQVPTVYPPISQAVFLVSAATTPGRASLNRRLVTMKLWLVLFDLGTLALLMGTLAHCQRPLGWAIAYGWCPLVMKEFANSGHLDAIAVFLTALTAYLMTRAAGRGIGATSGPRMRFALVTAAAVVLALAVGAKIYPIVLAPLMLLWSVRLIGWTRTLFPAILSSLIILLVMWPMLPASLTGSLAHRTTETSSGRAGQGGNDPSRGLQTFLRRWEMNDFLFLLVHENLRPADTINAGTEAWFVIVPDATRRRTLEHTASWMGANDAWEASFLTARILCSISFFAAAIWCMVTAIREDSQQAWLRAVFLTLAWFWLLSPTQNPWYWTWALAFIPFARSRLWLLLSGLAMVYYLRFWFQCYFDDRTVLGTPYAGEVFFDLVVTWLEFGPWLLCLLVLSLRRRGRFGPSIERAGSDSTQR